MSIAIVTTGGTIDKEYFDALSDYQVADTIIPKWLQQSKIKQPVAIVPLFRKDSLDITDNDRRALQEAIERLPQQQIFVTHGTDTMAESARFLSDITGKTIVFTGAMKPARFADSDAMFNVAFAMGALQALPDGVYVAMSGTIFDPLKVQKNRAEEVFELSR